MHLCVTGAHLQRPDEEVEFTRAGVTSSCELSNMGAENPTWIISIRGCAFNCGAISAAPTPCFSVYKEHQVFRYTGCQCHDFMVFCFVLFLHFRTQLFLVLSSLNKLKDLCLLCIHVSANLSWKGLMEITIRVSYFKLPPSSFRESLSIVDMASERMPLIGSESLTFPVRRRPNILIIAIYTAFLLFQVNKNVLQNPTFNSGMSGIHCLWRGDVGVSSVRKDNSAY